jgi:hypothetical protein
MISQPRQEPVCGTATIAASGRAPVRRGGADHPFRFLAGIAREARRRDDGPEGVPPPLLDAAFLVPATRRSRFKTAVRRLARDTVTAGAEVTLSGPWPAYNFVQSRSGG